MFLIFASFQGGGGDLTNILDLIGGKLTEEQIEKLLSIANSEGRNVEINPDGTFATTIGHSYVVSTDSEDVRVVDANDKPLAEVLAAGQVGFVANTTICKVSSSDCTVTEVFKGAATLTLSGGGLDFSLPVGYIPALFLEDLEATTAMQIPYQHTANTGWLIKGQMTNPTYIWAYYMLKQKSTTAAGRLTVLVGREGNLNQIRFTVSDTVYNKYCILTGDNYGFAEFECSYNFMNSKTIQIKAEGQENTVTDVGYPSSLGELNYFVLFGSFDGVTKKGSFPIRFFGTQISEGATIAADFLPAIDATGMPCAFETISKQPIYNCGTGDFVVGMTITQARKLGKLPDTNGSLRVSLPVGWDADEEVDTALQNVRKKGWTVTVLEYQRYAASTTYSLRRIWVRQKQYENGTYVDTEGNRWQVDWCVAMYTPDNSTPEDHGYEQFRSVEAAVDYWGLTPYIDPSLEEPTEN